MNSLSKVMIFAILIVVTFSNCQRYQPPDKGDTVFAVNVIQAIQGEIHDYIEVNGDVQTTASVDVFSNMVGEITRIHVQVGQYIYANQVIAEVDPSRPGQTFIPSPVLAPISGTITAIPVRVGSTISQATPVAKIARTSELELVTYIAERFIAKMKSGLEAIVRLEAFPDKDFAAKVTEISPVVDPLTRTLEIKLKFTTPVEQIKAGMFAEIKLIIEKKEEIIKIPGGCLVQRLDTNYVFVITEDSRVEMREIVPGIEIDNKLEVLSGLEAGELVVVQGQTLLEDQAKIKIIETVLPLSAEDIIE